MTQRLSRKKTDLALATALASPLVLANQFAGSALEAQLISAPNIAAISAASLGTQVIQLTELPIGTIQSGSMGAIVLTLDNDAKWISAAAGPTVTALPANAWRPCVIAYSSTGSNATLTLHCTATATPSTAALIKLGGITLDTSASTVDTGVKVTLAASSTFPGLTTGATARIATVKANGYSASTTAPTVVANSLVTLPTITLTENVPGMFKPVPDTQDEIRIDLPSGVNFVSATAVATPDANVQAGQTAAYTASSAGTSLAFDLSGAIGSTTAAGKISIAGGQFFIPITQGMGDLNATVSAKLGGSTTATTSTLKLATVVAGVTTNTFVEATIGGATDYNILYTGRSYGAGFNTGASGGLENDQIKLTETAPGALAAGGVVTLTLSTGKFYAGSPGLTATASGLAGTQTNLTTAGAVAGFTVSTASSSAAGSLIFSAHGNALDMTSASTGDLKVTIGGTTNVTSGAIKLATIAKASSASASTVINTFTPGSTTSTQLADIVITESSAGALAVGTLGIKLPANMRYDTVVIPTVTVTQGGTPVSGKVTAPATSHYVPTATGASASVYNLAITEVSDTQPYVITISGLQAKASSSAASGDISATIFGNDGAVTASASAAAEITMPSNFGAMPYSEAVKVGTVGSYCCNCCYYPPPSGPISSVNVSISFAPAGNDIGKQGSMFVAALINPGGALYCYGSSTGTNTAAHWVAYNGAASSCLPFYTGPLVQISNATILSNANLTGYSGSKLYVGYGFGGALSPAGTAFNSLVSNGTYSLVYTVP